jgi:mediator of RNA polymerase II transcription subunit 14
VEKAVVSAGGSGGGPEVGSGQENMPGVVMEGGSRDGPHTNHDRDTMSNGTNGAVPALELTTDTGKARAEPQAPLKQSQLANGSHGVLTETAAKSEYSPADAIPMDIAEHIQQLPPEIIHITEGFEPLSRLLSRLAQVTHNRLSSKIMELTSMPVPSSVVNGNGVHHSSGLDDNSADNIRKKVNLLKFADEVHANWTKALVISQWSRVSEDVSKIIDLKIHLDRQKNFYEDAFYQLMEVKRGLQNARVPNPDLRIAVEVLTTGKASWMPDVCFKLSLIHNLLTYRSLAISSLLL